MSPGSPCMRLRLLAPTLLAAAGLGPASVHAAWPQPVRSHRGMVATSDPRASQAGLEMLKKGGTAVDAAVAATLAIGVVEPFSAGIGGGGFATVYRSADQRVTALDFRERAPLGASRDMYLEAPGKVRPGASMHGHLAVAVPGTVAGMWALHQAGGRLPFAEVVAPALALAEQGAVVGERLAGALEQMAPVLMRHPEAARTFLKNGLPYAPGDLLIQRDLADTLRGLAADGPAGFYAGEVAQALATEMEEHGGLITLADLQSYTPVWRMPVSGAFAGHQVVSFPPPSSGGVLLLQMLAMAQRAGIDRLEPGTSAYIHVLGEAMRRAYADRARFLGDPAFVRIPVLGLLHPDYVTARWSSFAPLSASSAASISAGDPWPFEPRPSASAPPPPTGLAAPSERQHTANICVVDQERNAVSLTFTINTRMGSAVVVPGTGILLNNEMDDFSAAPGVPNAFGLVGGEANAIAPAKIPLSSMTPTLVLAAGSAPAPWAGGPGPPAMQFPAGTTLRLAVGAPGGSTIITTVLQAILGVLVQHQDVVTAVARPRVHQQWLPDVLRLEPPVPAEVRRGLFARGHTLVVGGAWGNATAVELQADGRLAGASDPRGEGIPAGY